MPDRDDRVYWRGKPLPDPTAATSLAVIIAVLLPIALAAVGALGLFLVMLYAG